MSKSNCTLLLIEDNEDDVFFMERALDKAEIRLPLQVATDGQEAMDYLSGRGKFSDRRVFPVPSLIFLDLKLPFVSGFEFLRWLREHSEHKELPVVILTSSSEERDRETATTLAVKDYLVKPPTPEMLLAALQYLPKTEVPIMA
jgi:DNA-binding response OmpR family regulator